MKWIITSDIWETMMNLNTQTSNDNKKVTANEIYNKLWGRIMGSNVMFRIDSVTRREH